MSSFYAMPRNLVLAASAGTGKTHALVGVIVHLVLGARDGGAVDPSRIVATTFSRKAAAEIRSRVWTEVERLATSPQSSVYLPGLRPATDSDLAKRARRALARLPQARFGTLHSFATGIVQRYAVELGLGPGFDLATEADMRMRMDDAIAAAIAKRISTDASVLRSLTEAAGGIDRVVSALRRILYQLEEDGRLARSLTIDPGDARHLDRKMDVFVEHARDLRSHPKFAEAATMFLDAWTSTDPTYIERAACAFAAVPATGRKSPEVEAFAVFRKELPGATNEERGRRIARAWRSRHAFGQTATLVRDVLADAEAEIEQAGRARASLGFGEVLRAARELLSRHPDVCEEVSSSIEALLVDEFQDTSRVQRDLLQLLWARPEHRAANTIPPLSAVRPRGLLVVGDRKQSIYGFRGADVGIFAELAVGLAGAPAREALGIPEGVTWEPASPLADFHALRENRRSIPEILSFANAFSARRFQPGDPPPELFEIDYVPETEDLRVPHERTFEPPNAPPVIWLRVQPKGNASTRLEEALVIASKIPTLGASYRDVAVLATTNGMLDAVAFALAQSEIPYVVAGRSFFRAREVSDLAAMLALVLDPHDRLAMLEVLRGPWAAVHDETLLALVEPNKGLVPVASWTEPTHAIRAEDRPALEALSNVVLSLSRCAGRLGAGSILREAVSAMNLESVLGALPRGRERVANVQKLLAMADSSQHRDARAFHAWLDAAKEQDLAESEAATFSEEDDAVRLLTIHASKGLDFPIVFLPEIGASLPRAERNVARIELGSGDQPNVLSVRIADEAGFVLEPHSYGRALELTKRRERAERQRLAYVAVTRPSKRLFLVGGTTRETGLDPGTSTLGALDLLVPTFLAVEDVEVPKLTKQSAAAASTVPLEPVAPLRPKWRSLPIAPTALADFDHCARRFELIHLLGLPEHARGARSPTAAASGPGTAGTLDARTQGTLAHGILERIPLETFSAPIEVATSAVAHMLTSAGIPPDHPNHDAIAARVLRFLSTSYARSLGVSPTPSIAREVAFVLPIDHGDHTVTLRGTMDLVVVWPDQGVDVIDYKSGRSSAAKEESPGYAFQLDVYALAARALHPGARTIRAGLAFLGSGTGEPTWRTLQSPDEIRTRITQLGDALMTARWTNTFPRVALPSCESIHCGFIGRCHAPSQE